MPLKSDEKTLFALVDSPPSLYRVRIPTPDGKRYSIQWVHSIMDAHAIAREQKATVKIVTWDSRE